MDEVIGLFPTPFLRVPRALDAHLVRGLVEHFSALADRANNASTNLSHTAMLKPSDNPLLVRAAELVTPKLADFGALLFGERLGWALKEMHAVPANPGERRITMAFNAIPARLDSWGYTISFSG